MRHWNKLLRKIWDAFGSIQGQTAQDFEQPDLVKNVPAYGRGVGTR